MRYVLLACVLVFAVAFDLGVFVGTPDDAFRALDPHRPATVVPVVTGRIHELQSRLRLHVSDLVDAVTATYRTWIRHGAPLDSEPQEM
jgi:hypothetical protein